MSGMKTRKKNSSKNLKLRILKRSHLQLALQALRRRLRPAPRQLLEPLQWHHLRPRPQQLLRRLKKAEVDIPTGPVLRQLARQLHLLK